MSASMNSDTSPAPDVDEAVPGVPGSAPGGVEVTAIARRSYVPALAIVAIIALLVDQVTKYLAVTRLELGERIPVIGDLLGWRLVYNPGAALSLGTGVTWIFTVVMVVVSVAVMVVAKRIGSRTWAIALGALLGGALGNLTDRLVREPGFGVGHVVDFIDYGVFIGNVADIAIVGAAVAIVALSLFGQSWDGSQDKAPDGGASGRQDGEIASGQQPSDDGVSDAGETSATDALATETLAADPLIESVPTTEPSTASEQGEAR
jgi:signal peptidase II